MINITTLGLILAVWGIAAIIGLLILIYVLGYYNGYDARMMEEEIDDE